MPHGEKYTVENCPFYKKGKRIAAARDMLLANPSSLETIKQARTIRKEDAEFFYSFGLCDEDIAMFLGVSVRAFAKWRRQNGIIRDFRVGGHLRRIKWDDVTKMLDEGYTDIAVAMFHNTKPEVIEKYKQLFWKGGSDKKDEASQVQENYV